MRKVEEAGRVEGGIGGKRRERQRNTGCYQSIQLCMKGSIPFINIAIVVRSGQAGYLVAILISVGREAGGTLSFAMLYDDMRCV